MKKLFTLVALVLIGSASANAQSLNLTPTNHFASKSLTAGRALSPASVTAIVRDTLFPPAFDRQCGDTITYYTIGASGIATGTNSVNLTELGTKVKRAGAFTVQQAFAFFFEAASVTNPDIFARAYQMNRFNAVDTGAVSRSESDPSPLSSIRTRVYSNFLFSTPKTYNDSALITIQIPSGASGDTIALATTRVGCQSSGRTDTVGYVTSFVKFNNVFRQLRKVIRGFTVDIAIVGVIEYDDAPVSVRDLTGETFVYPVPATSELNVVLPGNLKGSTEWSIVGMDGKVARTGKHSGSHMLVLSGEGLQGVYALRLSSKYGTINKRVIFSN
jgi:hypothetical protein